MILRSGKIVTKHSSAGVAVDTNIAPYEIKQNEEEEDIISRLPDEILTHILSLLPDADVYRTHILSNRWNNLCFFLPFLCFKMPDSHKQKAVEAINEFYDFVDKTLSLRNRDMPVIKRFFLCCSYDYHHYRVFSWLHRDRFSLSWNFLMTCDNTLVDLNLKGINMEGLDETRLLFPSLKRMKLESIKYSADHSPQNLISASPVLQELFLEEQTAYVQLPVYKISSPSLKRLLIQWCDFGEGCNVVIDAPKLEYFYIRESMSSTYSFTNPLSLVEAHIDVFSNSDIQLTNISSVGNLTIGSDSISDLSENFHSNLPVFPNLVKLIVDFGWTPECDTLFILLNSMLNLQHFTIDFGHHLSPMELIRGLPTEAPTCLRLTVKEIVIHTENVVRVKISNILHGCFQFN